MSSLHKELLSTDRADSFSGKVQSGADEMLDSLLSRVRLEDTDGLAALQSVCDRIGLHVTQ